jgi:hypothetical protein
VRVVERERLPEAALTGSATVPPGPISYRCRNTDITPVVSNLLPVAGVSEPRRITGSTRSRPGKATRSNRQRRPSDS